MMSSLEGELTTTKSELATAVTKEVHNTLFQASKELEDRLKATEIGKEKVFDRDFHPNTHRTCCPA